MSIGTGKRGRPPKFGRPGRLLAFTVPDDVREWLETVHHDPGWALVSLFEAATASSKPSRTVREIPSAEIALLVGRRGLIVVNRDLDIVYANAAAAELFDVGLRNLSGRPIADLWSADSIAHGIDAARQAIASGDARAKLEHFIATTQRLAAA